VDNGEHSEEGYQRVAKANRRNDVLQRDEFGTANVLEKTRHESCGSRGNQASYEEKDQGIA